MAIFLESIWEFQGLKKINGLTDKIKDVFYDECQGITAVAVNLFLLAQERALQDGKEELTVGIIRETAKNDLHMIQPMIKALRNNNLSEIMKYEDISINLEDVTNSYHRNIELAGIIEDSFRERKKDIELKRKSTVESLIVDLTEMDIFNNLELTHIRKICEKIVQSSNVNEEYSNQKMEALKEAMVLNEKIKSKQENETKEKLSDGLILIYELAKERKIHTYELLKKKGFIKNPLEEFLNIN